MKSTRIVASLIAALLLSACDKQVKDFVEGNTPEVAPPVNFVPAPPGQLKISPGAVRATSASMGMSANVTATNHAATSASMGAQIGVSKRSLQ